MGNPASEGHEIVQINMRKLVRLSCTIEQLGGFGYAVAPRPEVRRDFGRLSMDASLSADWIGNVTELRTAQALAKCRFWPRLVTITAAA
jgi:hypothetical protein